MGSFTAATARRTPPVRSRGGLGRDGGRHRGRRKPGGLAVAASRAERRRRAHRPRVGWRPRHQPGGDVEDGRPGRLAGGADRARGHRVRRHHRPGEGRRLGASDTQARQGPGRDALQGRVHRPDAVNAVCLPCRHRLLVQQLALFHHGLVDRGAIPLHLSRRCAERLGEEVAAGCAGGVCRGSRRALRRARGRPGGRGRRRHAVGRMAGGPRREGGGDAWRARSWQS